MINKPQTTNMQRNEDDRGIKPTKRTLETEDGVSRGVLIITAYMLPP